MDGLVWGIPFLLFVLICPLMMVGMAAFMWFGARLGFRRSGEAAAGGDGGHSGHMMCGPMMMGHGSHSAHEASSSPEEDVSALRERVEGLERQLAETRGGSEAGLRPTH